MPEQTTSASGATPVTIFGRTYHLRGSDKPEYLTQLASLLDDRMREIARATGTADTLKVAILASLNLADEWYQARRSGSRPEDDEERNRRLAHMVSLLDEALAEQEGRNLAVTAEVQSIDS